MCSSDMGLSFWQLGQCYCDLSSWLLGLVCEEHEERAEEHEQHYEKKKNLIKFNLRFFFKFKKKKKF